MKTNEELCTASKDQQSKEQRRILWYFYNELGRKADVIEMNTRDIAGMSEKGWDETLHQVE